MKYKRKNQDNIYPHSSEEARKNGKKGGIRSGESKREKKALREWLEVAFSLTREDESGAVMKSPADPRRNLTMKESAMVELVRQAAGGDLKAIELAAKLLGESETKVVVETRKPSEIARDIFMGNDE